MQFSDKSSKKPCRVVEELHVKVGKFGFLADFTVLDMEVDHVVLR